MKVIQVEVPDVIAEELDAAVKSGLFHSADEAVRQALAEFLRHNRLQLLERFQREDISWALQLKNTEN